MAASRPNIILLTTDQHRGDHIGLSGHPLVQTPNLDAWVNEGAYFPNAYTEIPSTTGARRCLHGGQGSYDCGLVGYASKEWHEPNTLAAVLAKAGYHCINVGWRNMHPRRKLYGFHTVIPHDLHEGDDDYMEWLREKAGPDASEYGHGIDANGWSARPWHLDERLHSTVWTTNMAVQQIKKRDPTKPLFIWISHLRPHSPYDPPRYFWDMYINKDMPDIPVGDWAEKYGESRRALDITTWCGKLSDDMNQQQRAGYMGTCTHIDYELGRLLIGREVSRELISDSLMIFTSDHGDMQSDHNLHRKCYAYEGSARIPFVVKYPKGLDAPTGVFDNVVGLQDVMPTILDVAGVDIPDSVTGQSVMDAIRGKDWREFIHGEHSPCYCNDEAMHYLTDGKEKFVYLPATGEERFFDLVKDRQELKNLVKAPEYADRVALWRKRLIDKLTARGDGFADGEKLLIRTDWWSPVVGE